MQDGDLLIYRNKIKEEKQIGFTCMSFKKNIGYDKNNSVLLIR